jgi:hypothetical protein
MPYLGSTLFVVVLVVSLLVSIEAYWLSLRALVPRFVASATERWSKRPIVTMAIGLALSSVTLVVVALLSSIGHPATGFLAGVLAIALLAVGLAGAAGLATRIGEGLDSASDAGRPWFHTLKGGVVLELVWLLPFLGWFVILPLAVAGGVGAVVQAMVLSFVKMLSPARMPAAVPEAVRA